VAGSGFDPYWKEKYNDIVVVPAEAVSRIRPGQRVFVGTGCAQPESLVKAMTKRARQLADTEVVHLLTLGDAPYAQKELTENFRVNSFFIAQNVRELIQEGLGDYTPIFLSEIPGLFESGRLPLDVALIQVSPPDEHGLCSLGISVDIVKSAVEAANLVIAEVNPNMPRTFGDSFLEVRRDIDLLVPADHPILETEPPAADKVTEKIALHVSSLIEDESTLELGIGRIPQACLAYLKNRKDLGIHTEMLTDGVIDLIESGAVTGRRKTLDRDKIVLSFAMGTGRLYDYVDQNAKFAFKPTEYVNDPFIISQQHKMVAINVALEVDLTGQVCADSLGTRFFSGIGGQLDFNRGAARSKGGRAIIALPSTAKNGTVSRIVPMLSPGAGVVTTRGDVHYVVTEYGVAFLHGKNVQERAIALISIAHPKFRAELLRAAIDAKYIRAELADKEGKIHIGPQEMRTTTTLGDGKRLLIRPIHPTDEPRMRDLFYKLSQQTIYYRFMCRMPWVPRKQIQDFVYIDHRTEVSYVAAIPAPYGEEAIALGCYYLDPATNRAEAALVVRDDWQGRGVGSLLLKHLVLVAKRNGIAGFTAEVLPDNMKMQHVLEKIGLKIEKKRSEGIISYRIDF